jgi:hypothetical protein
MGRHLPHAGSLAHIAGEKASDSATTPIQQFFNMFVSSSF